MAGKSKAVDATVQEVPTAEPVQFGKEQILASVKYRNKRDLVNALLEKDKKYTMEQVDDLIDQYMKGQVK